MQQFRDLVAQVLMEGEPRQWRNGHTGIGVFDHQMKFDMRLGFPLLSLKFTPWTSIIGELIGFMRGYTNAADFRALGCNVWNQNANEEPNWLNNPARIGKDDLGRIYGAQWREIRVYDGGSYAVVDQLQSLLDGLRADPHGRRHVVSAWNPGELHLMALPPCHMMFQCYCSSDGLWLDLKMYQRSADVFLGVPFNIASYAALLHILAAMTGRHPRHLTIDLGDVHLYQNSIEHAHTLLTRSDKPMPYLDLSSSIDEESEIHEVHPEDLELLGYQSHPGIKVEMAV